MPAPRVPLQFERLPEGEMVARATAFDARLQRRRTVREFSTDTAPWAVIEHAVRAAGSAPSGAHQQPWTFVVVSDAVTKQAIRDAAEQEEQRNYAGRMSAEWLAALEPLGTDEHKPHLTDAPHLIVVFEQAYGLRADGSKVKHYYVRESVGIAVGFLLAALNDAGLATLTHTPSPMGFLADLLRRPANERAYVVVAVGYPASGATVPDLRRKTLNEILIRHDVKDADGV